MKQLLGILVRDAILNSNDLLAIEVVHERSWDFMR